MTFIVSLSHFCEIHGPSMIMCTQTVDNAENLPNFYSPHIPESQLCQSCMLKIPQASQNKDPKELESNTISSREQRISSEIDDTNTNNSPKSSLTLEDQISNLLSSSTHLEHEKKRPMTMKSQSKRNKNTFFVSTQFPTYTERYSSLRQTIVRVFTAETNSDLSKPIIFGDSKHGYSIALSFSLVDKTARGSERKYSIIVTSNWEEDIANNYTFILTNLNKVVDHILKSARIIRKQSDIRTEDIHNHDIYLRRSAGLPKAKSIVEILQDENFFLKMHMWAAFLLDSLEGSKHV